MFKEEYSKYFTPFNEYTTYKKVIQRYHDMKSRCYNPNSKLYKFYGAKGIKVSLTQVEYLIFFSENYPIFLEKNGLARVQIGRIDHSKDYSLDNIELVTPQTNLLEQYSRKGNPSKRGTVLDDMACLTVHTFNQPYSYLKCKELAAHYDVEIATIRHIAKGINRKGIYASIYK